MPMLSLFNQIPYLKKIQCVHELTLLDPLTINKYYGNKLNELRLLRSKSLKKGLPLFQVTFPSPADACRPKQTWWLGKGRVRAN